MHRRTAIVDQVVAALAPTGYQVVRGSVYPESYEELPLINVRSGDESVGEIEYGGPSRPVQGRELTIVIELYVSDEVDVDSAADVVALAVETALHPLEAAPAFLALADSLRLVSSGEPEREGLDGPYCARELEYACMYSVDAADPQ